MTTSVDNLLAILDVRRVGERVFEGPPSGMVNSRAFGGHVVGQALAAASRTVQAERLPHSLHAYFLRPGKSARPILYQVEPVREGRTFSTRTVSAQQDGKTIFTMSASFHDRENGLDHQLPAPATPSPDSISAESHDVSQWPDIYQEWNALEFRHITEPVADRSEAPPTRSDESHRARIWMRATEKLPDDPVIHSCVIACVSDLTLMSVTLRPHGIPPRHDGYLVASLDHSVWFHRPLAADNWWLYDQSTPSASNALALAEGRIFSADGRLAVSVAQEGLLRPTARQNSDTFGC